MLTLCIYALLLVRTIAMVPFECQEKNVAEICADLITSNQANLPGFVRLAFHDCVGLGGCDGCIDQSNGDNAGLQVYIDALGDKYADHKIGDIMSRGDFWVLCSHVALEEGQKISDKDGDADSLSLNMVYGRMDCHPTNSDQMTNDTFPSPHGTYEQSTDYFGREFNLTADETVALLGAHTLGRARPDDSGFQNQWVDNEFALDNAFYKDILAEDQNIMWQLVDLNGDNDNKTIRMQWSQPITDSFKNLMFTSDMCLAYDVKTDDHGRSNQTFRMLESSPGQSLARTYATDNARWLADFSIAYRKMVRKVKDDSEIMLVMAKQDGNNDVCKEPTVATAKPVVSTSRSTTNSVSLLLLLCLTSILSFLSALM